MVGDCEPVELREDLLEEVMFKLRLLGKLVFTKFKKAQTPFPVRP